MLNSALWFWQARMNNTTGCCGSSAPSTKDWAKTVCYKITSNSRAHSWDCVMNKFYICYILICSFPQCDWKQTSATAARLSKMNMQTSFKSFTRVCINTKPSVSQRAKANALAYWFQWNYFTVLSKYVTHEPESRRRCLIKYAKLYLSTVAWICSGVHPSNHTKGGGMFPWNLPSYCNSSFPPLSNYCRLAVCEVKQR